MKKANPTHAPRGQQKTADNRALQTASPAIPETTLAYRLYASADIEKALQQAKKTPPWDRLIFAQNLGFALTALRASGVEISNRHLFIQAFGELGGESKYQKRKDYLLMPNESPRTDAAGNDRLAANPRDYLAIAKAIGSLDTASTDNPIDARMHAILRLTNGSSFDSASSVNQRRG